MAEWSEELGIPHTNIWNRNKDGMQIEKVLHQGAIARDLEITINGVTKTAKQLSKELGVTSGAIRYRFHQGMSNDELLHQGKQPHRNAINLTFNGKTQSQRAWARETGVPQATIRDRLRRNLPLETVLTPNWRWNNAHKRKPAA